MIEKESQHFGTRVRTGGIGVTASCIAACPRVRCAMNGPQLRIDAVGGNQPQNGTGTSARDYPRLLFTVDIRPRFEALHKPRGIRYVNRGIRVTVKDDDGPLR